ncbi:MAG: glycosyltransferase family 2 protein [Bacteroidetes bacterium]|nr:glycosyltransferase family 2 protein [Bacteroidota bacterium]
MLSILIPVYRYRIIPMLEVLIKQGEALKVPFEILVFDDASGFDYSEELAFAERQKSLEFRILPENLGRAAIRNKLAEEAVYPWLLFMDADSAVVSDDYLETYWNERSENVLLCGGTAYAGQAPEDPALYFRWYYGRNREQRPAVERRKSPFEGFSTHHFFCHQKVFDKVTFPDAHVGYGHEDTLFGFHLKEAGFQIRHLDNPLEHTGLEPVDVYLDKTREALRNLKSLKKEHPWMNTRLSESFENLTALKLSWIPWLIYKLFGRLMERNFRSSSPSLFLFDVYRLGYYAGI